MPHRQSLVRRLAELRREYTGETDSTLLPATTASAARLDIDDRAKVAEILGHDYVTRLFGENELLPPPARIRRLLLADTDDPNQQELESGILNAAGRVVNYLHLRQPADLRRPARVFRMVRPQIDELVLHLHPGVLGPLLLEMLPRVIDNHLVGIAGLRATVHRRHIELHLVDVPSAKVHVSNVTWRQWAAGLAFVDAAVPAMGDLRWMGNDPRPLTEVEQSVLTTRHRVSGPARLNSALLRRAGVFRDALWWKVWVQGCEATRIEWSGQPSLGRVAKLLLHPLYGLPGDDQRARYFDQDGLNLIRREERHCQLHPRTADTELVLRRCPHPDAALDSPGFRDATDSWLAWKQVLAAPNPFHRRLPITPSGVVDNRHSDELPGTAPHHEENSDTDSPDAG